eukprot:m51a1_g6359 hypothetical protein (428) ;mRNA; f:99749-101211
MASSLVTVRVEGLLPSPSPEALAPLLVLLPSLVAHRLDASADPKACAVEFDFNSAEDAARAFYALRAVANWPAGLLPAANLPDVSFVGVPKPAPGSQVCQATLNSIAAKLQPPQRDEFVKALVEFQRLGEPQKAEHVWDYLHRTFSAIPDHGDAGKLLGLTEWFFCGSGYETRVKRPREQPSAAEGWHSPRRSSTPPPADEPMPDAAATVATAAEPAAAATAAAGARDDAAPREAERLETAAPAVAAGRAETAEEGELIDSPVKKARPVKVSPPPTPLPAPTPSRAAAQAAAGPAPLPAPKPVPQAVATASAPVTATAPAAAAPTAMAVAPPVPVPKQAAAAQDAPAMEDNEETLREKLRAAEKRIAELQGTKVKLAEMTAEKETLRREVEVLRAQMLKAKEAQDKLAKLQKDYDDLLVLYYSQKSS